MVILLTESPINRIIIVTVMIKVVGLWLDFSRLKKILSSDYKLKCNPEKESVEVLKRVLDI